MSNVKIVGEVEKPKRLWDNYTVIGEVRKSDGIKFVVGAGIRDGVKYINVREFYLRKRDGIWNPGRDGITIPINVPIERGTKVIAPYIELIELFAETADALATMPLYDENNAVYAPRKVKKIND
jgi:hypothetical protein